MYIFLILLTVLFVTGFLFFFINTEKRYIWGVILILLNVAVAINFVHELKNSLGYAVTYSIENEFRLLNFNIDKANERIFLLVLEKDETDPRLYEIVYDEDMSKQLKKMRKNMDRQHVKGRLTTEKNLKKDTQKSDLKLRVAPPREYLPAK